MHRTSIILPIVAAAFACQSMSPPADYFWADSPASMIEAAPVDLALLPVVAAAAGEVPADQIREAAYERLVALRYSPLDLAFVDRTLGITDESPVGRILDAVGWGDGEPVARPMPASTGAAAFDADATVQFKVSRWNSGLTRSSRNLSCELEVFIVDGDGMTLWSCKLAHSFRFRDETRSAESAEAVLRYAVSKVVAQAFQGLPARSIR